MGGRLFLTIKAFFVLMNENISSMLNSRFYDAKPHLVYDAVQNTTNAGQTSSEVIIQRCQRDQQDDNIRVLPCHPEQNLSGRSSFDSKATRIPF